MINIKLCLFHQEQADVRFSKVMDANSWSESEWETWFNREWDRQRKTINTHCLGEQGFELPMKLA